MTSLFWILATAISFSLQLSLIQDRCVDDTDCPANSGCKPRGCLGLQCLCNENFTASADKTECKIGGFIGDSCAPGTNVQCISIMSFCDEANGHVCACQLFYRVTIHNACTYRGLKALGETCSGVNECAEIHGECRDQTCQCKDGYRPLTRAEFWADPNFFEECDEVGTSLEFCNGTRLIPLTSTLSLPSTTASETTTTTIETSTATTPPAAVSTTGMLSTTTSTTTTASFPPISATSLLTSNSASFTATTASTISKVIRTSSDATAPTATTVTPMNTKTTSTMDELPSSIVTSKTSTVQTDREFKQSGQDKKTRSSAHAEGPFSNIIIASMFIILLYVLFLGILIILRCKHYVIILTNEI